MIQTDCARKEKTKKVSAEATLLDSYYERLVVVLFRICSHFPFQCF